MSARARKLTSVHPEHADQNLKSSFSKLGLPGIAPGTSSSSVHRLATVVDNSAYVHFYFINTICNIRHKRDTQT